MINNSHSKFLSFVIWKIISTLIFFKDSTSTIFIKSIKFNFLLENFNKSNLSHEIQIIKIRNSKNFQTRK